MADSLNQKGKIKAVMFVNNITRGKSTVPLAVEVAKCAEAEGSELWIASKHLPENSGLFSGTSKDFLAIRCLGDQTPQPANLEDFDAAWTRLGMKEVDSLEDPRGFYGVVERHFGPDRFVNRPSGVMVTMQKSFLVDPDIRKLTPASAILETVDQVRAFAAEHPGGIVLKPLARSCGNGLVKVKDGLVHIGAFEDAGVPFEEYVPTLESDLKKETQYLGMKYLRNVSQGDKRVVVVDGKVVSHCLRVPKEGSWLCNGAKGGTTVPSPLTPEESQMAEQATKALKPYGVQLFGLDTLVDDDGKRVLSEINTNNVGGLIEADAIAGEPIIKPAAAAIWAVLSRCPPMPHGPAVQPVS